MPGHGDGHKLRKTTDCEGDASKCCVLKTYIIRTVLEIFMDFLATFRHSVSCC